jgi:hypothetical protein
VTENWCSAILSLPLCDSNSKILALFFKLQKWTHRLLNPYPNVKLALAHYSHMSLVMFPINKTWTFGSLPTEILRTSSNVFSAHQTPRSQTTDCRRSRVVTKAARTQQVAILLSGREVYCFFFLRKL